jgi:hypothetical protein
MIKSAAFRTTEGGLPVRALLVLFLALPVLAAEPSYDQIRSRFERVKAAVSEGRDVPESDLAAIIKMLREAKEDESRRNIVDRIDDTFDSGANLPASVKKYIVEHASPLLVALASDTKNSTFLRGDAIHALRSIGAPRAVLMDVAAMALKDSDNYVKSRGEIVENYAKNLPEETLDALKPTDAAKEREALQLLKERRIEVSLDQLRSSAMEADAAAVAALLAAGVDPNAGAAGDSPLVRALMACSQAGGENEAVLATVDALLAGGADVKSKDDNANTPLITAAQYCGGGSVNRLVKAGADVNATNGTGVNPLAMALIMSKLDAAEALAAKGAKLSKDQVTMVSGMATDPRAKAVIAKAKK